MKFKLIAILFIAVVASSTITTSLNNNPDVDKSYNALTNKNSWMQINEDGFGDRLNVASRGIAVFNDSLLVGTGNNDFFNGTWGELFNGGKFLQLLNDFVVNKKEKDFISNGCEIWSYKNNEWTCIVGNKGNIPGGFGDNNTNQVGFLFNYKNFLYVGVYNSIEGCQIWRTDDLENWEIVVEDGFGNKENFWAMTAIIFKDDLYVGTGNWNKSEIYKTKDGINWEPVVAREAETPAGFGMQDNHYMWSMCIYHSQLYVGTANGKGCEIWRTDDGVNWEPVVAYDNIFEAKKHGADHPRAFGKYWVGCARNMMVFNDELYIFSAIRGYARIIVQVFGKKIFDFDFVIPDLKYPTFNLAPRSGRIWKYNDTSEKWSRVVGGWGKTNNSAGFGDRLNQYLWAVSTYNEKMYVGTLHLDPSIIRLNIEGLFNCKLSVDVPTGKAELWSTSDGCNWEQVNNGGFGDEYNLAIRELEVYNDSLYACTVNVGSGCEVWEFNDS